MWDGGHAAHGALDQRGEGAAEQEGDGHVEHPALAAGAPSPRWSRAPWAA